MTNQPNKPNEPGKLVIWGVLGGCAAENAVLTSSSPALHTIKYSE